VAPPFQKVHPHVATIPPEEEGSSGGKCGSGDGQGREGVSGDRHNCGMSRGGALAECSGTQKKLYVGFN